MTRINNNALPNLEQLWQELRHRIEWTQGFALLFYFTDNLEATTTLKQRLEQLLIGRTTKLQTIHYSSQQQDWVEHSLTHLLFRDDKWTLLHAPLWLELIEDQREEALIHYREFLLRLNERRDILRKHYQQPIIIILPKNFQQTCRLAAPDLWSIRDFSEVISFSNSTHPVKMHHNGENRTATNDNRPLENQYQKQILKDWQRIEKKQPQGQGLVWASQRVVPELIKLGQFKEAERVATMGLNVARLYTGTPESLRDLSVSLNNVGNVSTQLGRWSDAQTSYEESLSLSRRLRELLGETPESLRDLCVSLFNIGNLLEQHYTYSQAIDFYQEGLTIATRLAEMLPNAPEYKGLPEYFLTQLNAIKDNKE